MFRNYLKIAWRSLFKYKLFTLVNITGLSVGMGAAMLILIWVGNELSFDQYHKHSKDLYRVICHWHGGGETIDVEGIPLALEVVASQKISSIEDFYLIKKAIGRPVVQITPSRVFEEKQLAFIGENWFEGFDYTVLAGDLNTFFEDKYSVAITKRKANQYFGTTAPIGETIKIDSIPYTIRLLLDNNPTNSSLQYDILVPLAASWPNQEAYEVEYQSGNYNYMGFVKRAPQADLKALEGRLGETLTEITDPDDPKTCSVIPLEEIRFDSRIKEDFIAHQSKSTVYIFGLIALILLITAGLNYINLSTAIVNKRVREIGVKKVIGADFRHIFLQLLMEAVLVSSMALSLSLLMVYFCLPIMGRFVETELRLLPNDPMIWGLFAGVFHISLLISGVYPAFLHAGFNPKNLIKANSGESQNGFTLRKVLVTTQFALTMVILIGTGVIYQQLRYIQKKDVGYNRSQIININPFIFRGDIGFNIDRLMNFGKVIQNIPGVEAVSAAEAPLTNITNHNQGGFSWEGMSPDYQAIVAQLSADSKLKDLYELQLSEGRWFDQVNNADRFNVVINEQAVAQFAIPEPVIGRPVKFRGREGKIVGVVKNFHFDDFHQAIEPLVIWNNMGRAPRLVARLSGHQIDQTLAKLNETFHEQLPAFIFDYQFLDESFERLHAKDVKAGFLFSIFAGLLIFISCLGLFGLAVFAAEQKTKEIGIRKVLGASVISIVGLLSQNFLKLVFWAFLVAIPLAFWGTDQWLNRFAYRVDLPWWVFLLSGLVMMLIAFFTISLHSIRAASVNPVESIRQR